MSNTERRCSKCEFYDANYGQCRVMPPVVQHAGIPYDEGGRIQNEKGWPNVNPDDWCGKFNSK
ncbi:MAG: hypothetical protein ABSA64_08100 [Sedimentisphaerales bacterium]|jgi:hypothetical protein